MRDSQSSRGLGDVYKEQCNARPCALHVQYAHTSKRAHRTALGPTCGLVCDILSFSGES